MMERKMKDSGIPWIGMIPEEWSIGRAKEMFIHEQRAVRDDDEVITCFRDGQVTLRKNRRTEGFTDALQEFGYQGIRKNDLVIHQMDAFAGSIGVSDSDGKGSPVLICCTPNGEYNTWYYCQLLRVMANQGWIKALYKGIRERSTDFRYDSFSQQKLPIPPLAEQEVIASWLDEKCGEIDELIDVEQKMIDELEAYRQATITETVTRGLNPDVPMRQTNISWIPEIPEHWEICRLKDLCSRMQSGDALTSLQINNTGKYMVYGGNGLRGYYEKCNFIGEAIIIGRQGALCGNVHYINDSIWATDHAVVTTPSPISNIKYLYYLANGMNLNQYASQTAAQPGLAVGQIKNVKTVIPPLTEQRAIADYLDTKCKEIDDLIALKREKIETLKLYRQSIIFEAVTGKIQIS